METIKVEEKKLQTQERPGEEAKMQPHPIYDNPGVKGCQKLKDKVAIITGGCSVVNG